MKMAHAQGRWLLILVVALVGAAFMAPVAAHATLAVPSAEATTSEPPNANGWFNELPEVSLIASNAVGVNYSWISDTGPWTPYSEDLETTQGVQTLYWIAYDGQTQGALTSQEFKVDTVNPYNAQTVAPEYAQYTSNGEAFGISWSAEDTTSPLTYRVQYLLNNAGSWIDYKNNATSTDGSFPGKAGNTYYFRTIAKDAAYNQSPASAIVWTAVPYDQGVATFSSGWGTYSSSAMWMGHDRYTSKLSANASFRFSGGKGLSILMDSGPTRGKVAVYVDGKLVKIVDTYSATWKHRQMFFIKSLTGSGSHTIKLVNQATSGRPRIDFDGIVVRR